MSIQLLGRNRLLLLRLLFMFRTSCWWWEINRNLNNRYSLPFFLEKIIRRRQNKEYKLKITLLLIYIKKVVIIHLNNNSNSSRRMGRSLRVFIWVLGRVRGLRRWVFLSRSLWSLLRVGVILRVRRRFWVLLSLIIRKKLNSCLMLERCIVFVKLRRNKKRVIRNVQIF